MILQGKFKLFNKALIASSFLMLIMSPFVDATTLKIGHVRPQGTAADNDIHAMADEIAKLTDNDVTLKVYPANALGDYTIVQERISVGAVDMSLQPASTSTDRKLQLGVLPYLAKDWPSAKRIYGTGSVLRNELNKLLAKQDITILAAYPVYFGGISLNRDAVEPGNPNASKGIKLRVPPIKSFQLLADSLGYIGAPLPFSEAFTAVQTGVVDGVIGSGAEGYYASFRDVTKTYIPLNTHFEVWYLMINTETFKDLSTNDQAAMKTAAKHFEEHRWEAARKDQKKNEQLLVSAGATIIKVTPEQLQETAKKIREIVWPEIIDDMGTDWATPILDQIKP